MKRFLSIGGLGDALINYSRLSSVKAPEIFKHEEIHIIHSIWDDWLEKSIREFYESQEVSYEIIKMHPNQYNEYHKSNKYDFMMCGVIMGNNRDYDYKTPNTWEANPYPILKIAKNNSKYNTILSPIAGRESTNSKYTGPNNTVKRQYLAEQVIEYATNNNEVILLGTADSVFCDKIKHLPNNLLNSTSLTEAMGIINNCDTVIAHDGFIAYLALMLNKKVYITPNNEETKTTYLHPEWKKNNITYLEDLRFLI